MGTDIHFFVEVRREGGWLIVPPSRFFQYEETDYNTEEWCRWDAGRDYDLFAALAGVRGDAPHDQPVAPNCGLPDDFSLNLNPLYGHSPGWCLLSDVLAYPYWDEVETGEWWEDFLEELKLLDKPENVRLTFYFDS